MLFLHFLFFLGIGHYIYKQVLSKLNRPNILLTSEPHAQSIYTSWGYKPSQHRACTFQGKLKTMENLTEQTNIEIHVQPMTDIFEKTITYEKSVSKEDRTGIFQMILNSPLLVTAQTATVNGEVKGFIVILRDINNAMKTSAFQAETYEIAQVLLTKVAKFHVPEDKLFTARFSGANFNECAKLYSMFGLEDKKDEYQGMYYGKDSNVMWGSAYSLLNYAISFV